jgi:alkylation response protein AidB-like acyl-CoA dehydrogenase
MDALNFPTPLSTGSTEQLRSEVRSFLTEVLADRTSLQRSYSWSGVDLTFSRAVGVRGWLGMTWPRRYGGHERTEIERYVVVEEMLAAGAPVSAHWIADRQTGPLILRFGTEAQKQAVLPGIARGECYACIGMSEPDAGSDLASVRTRAIRVDGGYRVSGRKVWTTNAHFAHYMVLFCRTSGSMEDRQQGTSQMLIDMSLPGISVQPIIDMAGEHHFNEVTFDDVFIPQDALLGVEGQGWAQVTSELTYERSGPERFLSSFTLITELARALGPLPDRHAAAALGRLLTHITVLRRMSRSVTTLLQSGQDPLLSASIVKDLGALVEQEVPEIARSLVENAPGDPSTREFYLVLKHTLLDAPLFSLRGGTREILRGIIARGLGVR